MPLACKRSESAAVSALVVLCKSVCESTGPSCTTAGPLGPGRSNRGSLPRKRRNSVAVSVPVSPATSCRRAFSAPIVSSTRRSAPTRFRSATSSSGVDWAAGVGVRPVVGGAATRPTCAIMLPTPTSRSRSKTTPPAPARRNARSVTEMLFSASLSCGMSRTVQRRKLICKKCGRHHGRNAPTDHGYGVNRARRTRPKVTRRRETGAGRWGWQTSRAGHMPRSPDSLCFRMGSWCRPRRLFFSRLPSPVSISPSFTPPPPSERVRGPLSLASRYSRARQNWRIAAPATRPVRPGNSRGPQSARA